jgi:hypothetical protein
MPPIHVVTLKGKVIEGIPVRWNALLPIEVTLSGMVILVKLLQPLNAWTPIQVTPYGIVTLVKLAQPSNA